MNIKQELTNYHPYDEQEEKDKKTMISFMDTFGNYLLRENVFGHFSASSWIVNKERTKVLMIYHNIYQAWSWTGGHADGEEDLLAVAMREAREETGIQNLRVLSNGIYSIEALTVNGHIKKEKYVSSHIHYNVTYLLEADEKESIKIKEDENSGVKWIPIDQAVKECSEKNMQAIYQKLNDKLMQIK